MPLASVWLVRPSELVNTGMPLTFVPGPSPIQPAARNCTLMLLVGSVLIQVVKISPSGLPPENPDPTLLALIAGCQSKDVLEAKNPWLDTKVCGLALISKL